MLVYDTLTWPSLFNYLGAKAQVLLDVGSNDGGTSQVFQTLFPFATVHAFEIDKRAILNCMARIHANKIDSERFFLHQKAISSFTGKAPFYPSNGQHPEFKWYQSGFDLAGSLNKPHQSKLPGDEWLIFETPYQVEVSTLDQCLEPWNYVEIDLLHMDVQGGELNAIIGAPITISKCKFIYLECEDTKRYENQPDISRIEMSLPNHKLLVKYRDGNYLFKHL
jgi:FkbM family methyltransferase